MTLRTYTSDQLSRFNALSQRYSASIIDSHEINRIARLGIDPDAYYTEVARFVNKISKGSYNPIPNTPELYDLYKEHLEYGCKVVMSVDNLLIGTTQTWGCLFCPCCILEQGSESELQDPSTLVDPIWGRIYIIKDVRSCAVLCVDSLDFHLLESHRVSAGLKVETMVHMLGLAE